MADEDINLTVGIGSSAESLKLLTDRMQSTFEMASKVVEVLDKLPNKGRDLKTVLSQLSFLTKAVSSGNPDVGLLNAITSAANKASRAVKEIDVQKLLSNPRGVSGALRSSDPQNIATGLTANKRVTDNIQLELERLRQSTALSEGITQRSFQAQVRRLEKNLEQALKRANAAEIRLQQIQQEALNAPQPLTARQRRARDVVDAGVIYRQDQLEKRAAQREIERKSKEAETLRIREENFNRGREVGDAGAIDRVLTARDRQRQRADFENFNREPVSIAARRVTASQTGAAVQRGLSTNEAYIESEVERRLAQQSIRGRVQDRYQATPEGQAQLAELQRRSDEKQAAAAARAANNTPTAARDRRQEFLFGDGGLNLLKTQAQLQAQYVILNSVYTAFTSVTHAAVEFDTALKEIQAVSSASEQQVAHFRDTILDLSSGTKFSAVELTHAAIQMAQAGLSLGQISDLMTHVAETSIATGEQLKHVAEIFITAVDVFKVNSKDAATVQNQLFVALNGSRLTVEKLGTAFSLAANVAHDLGLSFADTTAALAAMSNQGITTGNQLGTGLRLTLLALEEPTKKFADRLRAMGINLSDISVSSNGMVGALENLAKGGFTAADAFATMDRRMANAFVASLKSVANLKDIKEAELLATGASDASGKAMESLGNRAAQLGNNLVNLVIRGTGPLFTTLKVLTGGLASATTGLSHMGTEVIVISTVVEGVAIAAFGRWVVKLLQAKEAFLALRTAIGAAQLALVGGEAIALGPIGWIIGIGTALAVAIGLFGAYGDSASGAAKTQEELTNKIAASKEAFDSTSKSLEAVTNFLDSTTNKANTLQGEQGISGLNMAVLEARSRFGNLNSTLYDNITTVGQLTTKILELRHQLSEASGTDLVIFQKNINDKIDLTRKGIEESKTKTNYNKLLIDSGVYYVKPAKDLTEMAAGTGITTNQKLLDNPAFAAALKVLQPGAATPSQNQIGKILSDLGSSGLSKTNTDPVFAALASMSKTLSQITVLQTQDKNAARDKSGTDFYARPDTKSHELEVQKAYELLGNGKRFTGNPSSKEGQAAFDQIKPQIVKTLADQKAFEDSLSASDLAAFKHSPASDTAEKLKAAFETASRGVTTRTQEALTTVTTLSMKATGAEFQDQLKQLQDAKSPEIRAKAKAKALETAKKLYDDQLVLNEQEQTKRTLQGRDTALLIPLAREAKREADAKYQVNLDRINKAGSKVDRVRADPNRDLNAVPTDNQDISLELHKITDTYTNKANQAGIPLKGQEAFIQAAGRSGRFPQALIDIKKRELDEARAKQNDVEMSLRATEINALDDLKKRADTALANARKALDDLKAKYGIVVDADGTPHATAIGTEADRKTAVHGYTSLIHQISGLEKNSQTIATARDTAATSYQALAADSAARNAPLGGPGTAFADSALNFVNKNSFNDKNSFKQYGDSFSQIMSSMQSSTSQFIDAFVSGNTKGKASFAEFVRSILADALKVVASKAAGALLGTAFTGISGLLGFTSTPAASTAGAGAGIFDFGSGTNLNITGRYNGGMIPRHFSGGGIVGGPDYGRDTVPAMLAGGEGVLNRRAVGLVGENFINAMNQGAVSKGGGVPAAPAPRKPDLVNVYVVDKSTPPTLGPKDILATIGEDIRNGGQTKTLIHQVMLGNV